MSNKSVHVLFALVCAIMQCTGGDIPLKGSLDREDIDANDVGMISYFNGDCPKGWRKYSELSGRFPLAAGHYIGKREDGAAETRDLLLGDYGGEINHVLTQAQMPRHNHEDGAYQYLLKNGGHYTTRGTYYAAGDPKGQMQPRGSNQPHNNMPPYLVLNACEKLQSSFDAEIIRLTARVDMLERLLLNKKEL